MEGASLKYLGIFFLIAAAQGIFFSVTQLSVRSKINPPRIFLSLIIFFFSCSLIESGMWWSETIGSFVHIILISEPLPFLFGPLIYFYFKSSVTGSRFRKVDWLHALPFLLYFVYCSQFYFNSAASKTAMMENKILFRDFFKVDIDSAYVLILNVISLCLYGFFTWKEFYKKTLALKEIKHWFLLAFSVYVFYVISFTAFHLLARYRLIGGCADYAIAISIAVFIYLFSWFGFVRPRVFDGYSLQEALRPATVEKYKSSVLTASLESELVTRLQELMVSEKLYKDEGLRLDVIAERLGVSRNSVSQVINSTGMNFFEYVNHWRIEEAKKLLSATAKKDLNIIEVAYEVGFNNKVSFNKHFKKSTGLTPTEFRKLAGQ